MPLPHTKCSIIKINGDYLDIRTKNTPTELEQYDERLNKSLDRVFDEFGLIVCGWSGEWDTALRAAIERCPNRRFTTFWAARTEPEGVAKDLLGLRSGFFVKIQNANSFFEELAEKVSALQELDRPHPLSAKVAVTSLKKYLVDERYRIRLHDLVMQEVEKLYIELSPDHSALGSSFSVEELTRRVRRYEALTEILLAIMVTGCYWGGQSHKYLWVGSLERIANPPQPRSGIHFDQRWHRLTLYPALLLLYAAGIASLASEQYDTFAELLIKPIVGDFIRNQPIVLSLYTLAVMEKDIAEQLLGMGRRYTPLSDYLYNLLREPLKEFLPQDIDYQKCFDRFEYLFALVYTDLNLKQKGHGVGPAGSFFGRRRAGDFDIVQEIAREVNRNSNFENGKSKWLPLQVGLFDNSLTRFQEVKDTFDDALSKTSYL